MIRNITADTIIAAKPFFALRLSDRARGMIGRSFHDFDAMVFDRCSAIHMCFMKIKLDVIFLDKEKKVLKAVPKLAEWTLFCGCAAASWVLELPEGTIQKTHTQYGDRLEFGTV